MYSRLCKYKEVWKIAKFQLEECIDGFVRSYLSCCWNLFFNCPDTNVLNKHSEVHSIQAFSSIYNDTGFFGIHGASVQESLYLSYFCRIYFEGFFVDQFLDYCFFSTKTVGCWVFWKVGLYYLRPAEGGCQRGLRFVYHISEKTIRIHFLVKYPI